jgi:hypothetical protein
MQFHRACCILSSFMCLLQWFLKSQDEISTCNASASSVKWAGSYWTLHRWSPMDWFLLKRDILTRSWLDFYSTLFPVITHLFLINLWSAVNAFCYIPVNSWFSVLAHWRVCIGPRFWEIFHGRVYIETWSQIVASETCRWMSPVGGVVLNSAVITILILISWTVFYVSLRYHGFPASHFVPQNKCCFDLRLLFCSAVNWGNYDIL